MKLLKSLKERYIMPNIFTHKGILKAMDSRLPPNYSKEVFLRETKTMWITDNKARFSKHTGFQFGDWPLLVLDLKSIKPLEDSIDV
jgi:hypothetical protein